MKKLIILLIVLLGLGWIAWSLKNEAVESPTGIVMPDRQFAVDNLEDVSKIFVAQKNMEPILFTKTGKQWMVNDSFRADDAVVVNMLAVLQRVKMLYVPPKSATKTIVESIGKNGIKVELYDQSNKKLKVFYIGTDTQDGDGTHMIMEGAAQPYVMHLPGLRGGLRSRFEQPLRNYRDKAVFEEATENIQSVEVFYHKDINASFKLNVSGSKYTVKPFDPLTPEIRMEPVAGRVRAYLDGFERVAAEAINNENASRDSILQLVPFCTLTLKTKNEQIKEARFYSYDEIVIKDIKTRTVNDIEDIDRFFLQVKDGDFYIVQRRVFGKLLKDYNYFFIDPAKL